MKIVKASVIVMGLLIVLGMGLLVYGFATRLGKAPSDELADNNGPLVPLVEPGTRFGDIPVPLESGEIVIDVQADASRLLVRTKLPDGTEVVRVFDLSSGTALGRFTIGR